MTSQRASVTATLMAVKRCASSTLASALVLRVYLEVMMLFGVCGQVLVLG